MNDNYGWNIIMDEKNGWKKNKIKEMKNWNQWKTKMDKQNIMDEKLKWMNTTC